MANLAPREERLSLQNYGAGRDWEVRMALTRTQMIAVEEMLFQFVYAPADGTTIRASSDYGIHWYEHSKTPHDIMHLEAITGRDTSGSFVYIIGSSRYATEDNDTYDIENVAEVWLSKDAMMTFELVTENAEFFGTDIFASCVRSDGSILFLGNLNDEPCTWLSKDCGKTWSKLFKFDAHNPGHVLASLIVPGPIVAFEYCLYAKTENDYDAFDRGMKRYEFIKSKDNGITWERLPLDFCPLALVHDTNCNRLISFNPKDAYQMCSGATEFAKLQPSWRCALPGGADHSGSDPFLVDAFVFSSGNIMLNVHAWVHDIACIISRPRRYAVRRDKMFLGIIFARFGVSLGLFTNMIAPFIFPF